MGAAWLLWRWSRRVQMGTRFVCAVECAAHIITKKDYPGGDRDTVVCGLLPLTRSG